MKSVKNLGDIRLNVSYVMSKGRLRIMESISLYMRNELHRLEGRLCISLNTIGTEVNKRLKNKKL